MTPLIKDSLVEHNFASHEQYSAAV